MKPNPNNPGECCPKCRKFQHVAIDGRALTGSLGGMWVCINPDYSCHSSAPKDTQTIPCIKRNGYCPHCGVTHKDTQSTNRIRLCLKDNGVGNPTHAKMVDIPAPPPTGAQEWEKEFDEKWLLYMGDCKCNKEAFFKPFIRTQITAAEERGKEAQRFADEEIIKKKYLEAGAAEHHKRVVEMVPRAFSPSFIGHCCACGNDIFCQQWNACRAAMLEALTTIDPEKK